MKIFCTHTGNYIYLPFVVVGDPSSESSSYFGVTVLGLNQNKDESSIGAVKVCVIDV